MNKRCPKTGRDCELTGCPGLGCMLQGEPQPQPMPPLSPHQQGWQCPKCGRGNAPFVHSCPCGPIVRIENTCGTS